MERCAPKEGSGAGRVHQGEVWRGAHLRRGSGAGRDHQGEVWRGMHLRRGVGLAVLTRERYGEVWT